MEYLPLFIRVKEQPCLVVGGGEVAARKVRLLLRANARVTVQAPELNDELEQLTDAGQLTALRSAFDPTASLTEYRLIIAATNAPTVNAAVAETADRAGIVCNVVDDRERSSAIVPALIDRSPLIVAVSTGGASPVLATRVRQQIERLLPPRMAQLAGFADRWRAHIKQRFDDLSQRRRFWQEFFDGPAAQAVLDGRRADAEEAMEQPTGAEDQGFAWIVGAGPGDPELITLKAARILATADTILHDRLVAPAILDLARRDAQFVSVGKTAGQPSIGQDAINELLVEHVRRGERVCRLKGGDPFIFGRGGEEIEALEAAGLPWQVIPGVTAASGCAAAAGAPLTHRQLARSVTFVTAFTADGTEPNWESLRFDDQTVVFYMAVKQLPRISEQLVSAGRPAATAALIIENGTTDQQRMIRGTLETIPALAKTADIASPAVLLVGAVGELQTLVATSSFAPAAAADQWAPAANSG